MISAWIWRKRARIRADSTAAVAYVNKMGSTKSMKCHKVTKNIFTLYESLNIELSAEHLPGVHTVIVDKSSKKFDNNKERALNYNLYLIILHKFGPVEMTCSLLVWIRKWILMLLGNQTPMPSSFMLLVNHGRVLIFMPLLPSGLFIHAER